MDLYILLAISLAVGWIAWSIRGPRVKTDITWADGHISVKGPVSTHQKQELHDFFVSQFADVPRLKVLILAESRSMPTRPRIQIRGRVADDQGQSIRNFLASRLH